MLRPTSLPAWTTRRVGSVALAAWMLAGPPSDAAAQTATPSSPVAPAATSSWFRIFLTSGDVIATPTEFTRIEDVVLVQLPMGHEDGRRDTRSVTLAASQVDWVRTEAYCEAVRRAQFDASGGARAFAAFSEDVADTLRQVAEEPDALERIRRLENARSRLADWPARHHGYRAAEVSETLSVIDDLLHGLRAAAGQQTFTLALTASSRPTGEAGPVLLPPPTVQEQVGQSLAVAPHVTDPVERLQVLESAARLLEAPGATVDAGWAREARSRVRRQISQEHRVTRAYARLRTWMLEKTTRLLALADVRGLMRLREEVQRRDARLDQARPAEVQALLGTVDARLEMARRYRLQLERWEERRPVLERYAGVVARHVAASDALLRALEDVRTLSGPGPSLLTQAEGRLAGARADAGLLAVPDEARGLHQTWLSAQQLATRALQTRRAAMRSGDMPQAWEASAAAAGALLLLQQLRTELTGLVRPPVRPGQGS